MRFYLRNNNGRLAYDFDYRGQQCIEYLGRDDTRDNRRQATKRMKDIRDAIAGGSFDYAKEFPQSKNLARLGLLEKVEAPSKTLAEYAQSWLENRALTPESKYDYACQLNLHVLPYEIAKRSLTEIKRPEIEALIKALQDKGTLSARRINMVIARLRTMFADAFFDEVITVNPMLRIKNLDQPKVDADPFDLEEARAILAAAEGFEKVYLSVLLFAGLRPNEALALQWKHIDWRQNLILVRGNLTRRGLQDMTKTKGSQRDVDMIPTVREALKEQQLRSGMAKGWVFPSEDGTGIDLSNFRERNWKRILVRAKVRWRTIYQCRHSFAKFLLEQGATPQYAADQLGHTGPEMVFRVYGRWMQRQTSTVGQLLDKAIKNPAESLVPYSSFSGGKLADFERA